MNNINLPPVVKNLLIINVLFFAAKYVLNNIGLANLDYLLGAFYIDSPFFRVWQLVTYMFMHGDIAHIFFNMFALFMFGGVIESRWGAKRFLNFYLITGLGAVALQLGVQAYEVYHITGSIFNSGITDMELVNQGIQANISIPGLSEEEKNTLLGIYGFPMVGASGAVFGLLVAFGMLYPNTELYIMLIPIPIKAKFIIPIYILAELFLGVARIPGDSIAHYAHLGGALLGFILVKLWKDKDNNRFYKYYE
ncbi:putative transmembrane rhomboid family protein [Pedobacter sp. BAL39]|uniref:rhomboid family intramembrane serine protease n=1 Tax=Pedobacter sp. BAL39 TaxID=391596 RepID=UPI000155B166|nr:rhomboid family intramembrane serine protease [Pedobacter sp. BAL39]EDM34394.1 putative transmembrane rhomboid family protein [Pedobacter sp. BAL39]